MSRKRGGNPTTPRTEAEAGLTPGATNAPDAQSLVSIAPVAAAPTTFAPTMGAQEGSTKIVPPLTAPAEVAGISDALDVAIADAEDANEADPAELGDVAASDGDDDAAGETPAVELPPETPTRLGGGADAPTATPEVVIGDADTATETVAGHMPAIPASAASAMRAIEAEAAPEEEGFGSDSEGDDTADEIPAVAPPLAVAGESGGGGHLVAGSDEHTLGPADEVATGATPEDSEPTPMVEFMEGPAPARVVVEVVSDEVANEPHPAPATPPPRPPASQPRIVGIGERFSKAAAPAPAPAPQPREPEVNPRQERTTPAVAPPPPPPAQSAPVAATLSRGGSNGWNAALAALFLLALVGAAWLSRSGKPAPWPPTPNPPRKAPTNGWRKHLPSTSASSCWGPEGVCTRGASCSPATPTSAPHPRRGASAGSMCPCRCARTRGICARSGTRSRAPARRQPTCRPSVSATNATNSRMAAWHNTRARQRRGRRWNSPGAGLVLFTHPLPHRFHRLFPHFFIRPSGVYHSCRESFGWVQKRSSGWKHYMVQISSVYIALASNTAFHLRHFFHIKIERCI